MNEQERAAFRAFVRDHHPDRGGDPDFFVAGMDRFRAAEESRAAAEPGADGADEARFDAPIEVVARLPGPVRVAVALIRTLRWHRNRRML